MKRCPFCNRIVWFWQSKAYVDTDHPTLTAYESEKNQLCHEDCLYVITMTGEFEEDHLIILSPNTGLLKRGTRKNRIEKVEDDTWKKGEGIEK